MVDFLEGARNEHARWRQREARLLNSLTELEEERRRLADELVRVNEQVAYYESLTQDMKKEIGRPARYGKLSSLLSSLRRP